jgi:toxin CptA
VIGALLSGGVLASVSVFLSDMPRPAAWLLAAAVLGHALWLVDRESRRPVRSVVFPGNDLPVTVDGVPMEQVEVQWRGPLAFVSWKERDGRRLRLSWWPDTLPPARRRELRLAAGSLEAARGHRQMAP